jgi:hypothetical protein
MNLHHILLAMAFQCAPSSLWADLYIICEDQAYVVNVVVINLIRETVATSVINQHVSAVAKLSIKICKYRGLHKGHHFIPMAMEVHDTPKHDMDRFIKECVCLFQDRQ